jgi:RNA polymerase sigma-B factor
MTVLATPTSITGTRLTAEPARRPASGQAPSRTTGVGADLTSAEHRPGDPPVATEQLLSARRRLPVGHPDRNVLRARAITDNLPLADRLAWRYAGRGERFDDLRQVAALALVTAVDGYDPDRSTPFVGYAVPTIIGALKRHFRDTAWSMRVPRSTQELLLDIRAAVSHLTQLRGRSPTSVELADHLRVNIDVLRAAVTAAQVYRPPSLNETVGGHDGAELVDQVGAVDPHYAFVDDHLALRSLVAALTPRQRRILTLRFYEEMTQARIAAEIGVTQMHVRRLLRQALAQLRVGLLAAADAPTVAGPAPHASLTDNP